MNEFQGKYEGDVAVYHLSEYKTNRILCTSIVSKSVTAEKARDAWTHTVKYTAKALDLPDYEAALELLQKRYPSWYLLPQTYLPTVNVELGYAESDIADDNHPANLTEEPANDKSFRLFQLTGYSFPGVPSYRALALLPGYTDNLEIVRNAWAYAVRYSAKALETPNHKAAVHLMLERHPTWAVLYSAAARIAVDLRNAQPDVPEVDISE